MVKGVILTWMELWESDSGTMEQEWNGWKEANEFVRFSIVYFYIFLYKLFYFFNAINYLTWEWKLAVSHSSSSTTLWILNKKSLRRTTFFLFWLVCDLSDSILCGLRCTLGSQLQLSIGFPNCCETTYYIRSLQISWSY